MGLSLNPKIFYTSLSATRRQHEALSHWKEGKHIHRCIYIYSIYIYIYAHRYICVHTFRGCNLFFGPGDLEFVEVDARSFFKFNGSNATAAPGDSSWSRQWGMRRSGFEAAWAKLEQMEMEPKEGGRDRHLPDSVRLMMHIYIYIYIYTLQQLPWGPHGPCCSPGFWDS